MVERLSAPLADILTATRCYRSEHLFLTLQRCNEAYDPLIPQRNLGHLTPIAALRQWYDQQPEWFHSDPHNLPGPDTIR